MLSSAIYALSTEFMN